LLETKKQYPFLEKCFEGCTFFKIFDEFARNSKNIHQFLRWTMLASIFT